MRITLSSLMLVDQDKALASYTGRLGFERKNDIPMGPITAVVFEDDCGNPINLVQPAGP